MEKNLVEKISAWTEGQFEEAALVEAIEAAAEVAHEHRTSFGSVVEELTAEQQERCGDLVTYAFSLLDTLENELQEVLDGLEAADKERVIISGDMIHRASFSLNQAFAEFRNQALAALGPTDIPNLNHLISVKNAYLADPSDANRGLLQESIDVERLTSQVALKDLIEEPQIDEVVTLRNAFTAHMESLNRFTQDLAKQGAETDFDSHFAAFEMEFRELGTMIPMVNIALRAQGDTDFPDLNYLFSMISAAEAGTTGDGPLAEALHAVEAGFTQTYEMLKASLPVMESALVKEEIEAAIGCFGDFQEGVQSVYRFLLERERFRLAQARGYLMDFATNLSAHKERLKELEALEGKVTCPRCSTVNDSDRQRCLSCGSPLPQNVGSATTSTFEHKEAGGMQEIQDDLLLTGNMVKIYEAINAVHAGTMEDAAFLTEIEKFENLVSANSRNLPPEPNVSEPAQQDAVNELYNTFEEGIERLLQGTELCRNYLETRDEELLKEAVRIFDSGAKAIDAADKAVSSVTPA